MCDKDLFDVVGKFTNKQLKDTLKTACAKVYSGDYERLGELQLAIDLFILANDMGDEVYKQKCDAYQKLQRHLKNGNETVKIEA